MKYTRQSPKTLMIWLLLKLNTHIHSITAIEDQLQTAQKVKKRKKRQVFKYINFINFLIWIIQLLKYISCDCWSCGMYLNLNRKRITCDELSIQPQRLNIIIINVQINLNNNNCSNKFRFQWMSSIKVNGIWLLHTLRLALVLITD